MATVTPAQDVLVPDIGDFSDVPVIEIHVAPGDTIAPEDPLVTLESDKATMDVPAPVGGVVQELKVSVGDTVSEGSPLLTVSAEDGGGTGRRGRRGEPRGRRRRRRQGGAQPGRARRRGGRGRAGRQRRGRRAARPRPHRRARRRRARARRASAAPARGGRGAEHASPAVRRLARELGVDLTQVQGSGRKGRITKEDLEAALAGTAAPAPAAAAADGAGLGLVPWPKVDFEKYGPVERQPLPRIKKISGPVLHRNWVMIPHVTHHEDADITELEAFRKRLNEEHAKQGVKVTMVALLVKASVAALQKFPRLQRLARRRRPRGQALLPHRLRRRHAAGPRRAGHQATPTRRA